MASQTLFFCHYNTNDDVALRQMVSGKFTPDGVPTALVMHLHAGLSGSLATLYRLVPSVPWYDLTLGALLLTACAVLLSLMASSGFAPRWILAAGIAASFALPVLTSVQFTVVAMSLAIVGILVAVRSLLHPEGAPNGPAVAVAMIAAGSMVRPDSMPIAIGAGVILAAPLLLLAPGASRRRVRAARLAGAIVATAVLSMALHLGTYFTDSRWRDVLEANLLRMRLTEYLPAERAVPEVLDRARAAAGWSANDYAMLPAWLFVDAKVFGLDRLRLATAATGQRFTARDAGGWLRDVPTQAKTLVARSIPYLLLAAGILTMRFTRRLLVYGSIAAVALLVIDCVLWKLTKALPFRVFVPLNLLLVGLLAEAARTFGVDRNRAWRLAGGALVSVAAIVSISEVARETDTARQLNLQAAADAVKMAAVLPGHFLLVQGASFPFQHTWRPLRTPPAEIRTLWLGNSALAPVVQDYLRRSGREDVFASLCRDPDAAAILTASGADMIRTYLREHDRQDATFEQVFSSQQFSAYRCTVAEPGPHLVSAGPLPRAVGPGATATSMLSQ